MASSRYAGRIGVSNGGTPRDLKTVLGDLPLGCRDSVSLHSSVVEQRIAHAGNIPASAGRALGPLRSVPVFARSEQPSHSSRWLHRCRAFLRRSRTPAAQHSAGDAATGLWYPASFTLAASRNVGLFPGGAGPHSPRQHLHRHRCVTRTKATTAVSVQALFRENTPTSLHKRCCCPKHCDWCRRSSPMHH